MFTANNQIKCENTNNNFENKRQGGRFNIFKWLIWGIAHLASRDIPIGKQIAPPAGEACYIHCTS